MEKNINFYQIVKRKNKKKTEGEKNKRGREIELFFQVVYYPIKRSSERKQNELGSANTEISGGLSTGPVQSSGIGSSRVTA
jgi:hypothetical protein